MRDEYQLEMQNKGEKLENYKSRRTRMEREAENARETATNRSYTPRTNNVQF